MTIIKCEDDIYPDRLKNIPQRPEKLYAYGNLKLLDSIGIAVIGSRHHSEYGRKMCKQFTKDLVQNGVTIISGLAEGIDTISHKTCLENGGKTIAVIPCGINNMFPKFNKNLVKDIISLGGAVISEYAPDEKADSKKFLKRNRIVSGLAIGTLVVEAGYRSGTSVTARVATEQGRKVFSIPSSLDNMKGVMSNQIIQRGAKLVTCIDDILNEFENVKFIKRERIETNCLVDHDYIDVFNLLNNEPQHINELAKKLNYNIQEINYKLMMLEIDGHIIQLPGKNFIRK